MPSSLPAAATLSGEGVSPAATADAGGEAEVGDLRAAAAVNHDVGGLQVPVQHSLVVRRGESRAELVRDLDCLVRRKPADAPQQRGQVLAVDVLHGEEVPPLDLA